MQGLIAADEVKQFEYVQSDFKTVSEYGIHQLDVTLIRPTNYTNDGYPIKTRIGVIRSNTLTQIGTLVQIKKIYILILRWKGSILNIAIRSTVLAISSRVSVF